MAVYYAAVDKESKKIIHPQDGETNKWPRVLSRGNRFAGVVALANQQGHDFRVISDVSWGAAGDYEDPELEDVSQEWYDLHKELMDNE